LGKYVNTHAPKSLAQKFYGSKKTIFMKRTFTHFGKAGLVVLVSLFTHFTAKALTYTAVASGNFSSAATWGGVTPPTSLVLDNVVIPSGINVTLDQNVTISGLLSTMDVNGSLTSTSNTALVFTGGALSGAGTIDVDSLVLNAATGLTFTGNIIADDISTLATGISTSADITVSNQLWLGSGSLDFLTNSSLTLSSNATIVVSGGVMTNSGGSLNLNNGYNVVYNTASAVTGIELTGSGLQSVVISVPSASAVTLSTDLTVKGALALTSGRLILAGNDLTISSTGSLNAGGTGTVVSTASSDITINAAGGTMGTLTFSGNSSVDNLTISTGANLHVRIGGTLTVDGGLNIASGILEFSDATLILNDTITGSGSLYGNANADLTVNASGGLGTTIRFAANGQQVNDLDISISSGGAITLGSNLTVNGSLTLDNNNQLNISNVQLTVDGGLSGSGTLTTNSGSGININTTSATNLRLTGTNGTVGTLTFNGTGATSLTLNGDLTVSTLLALQSGTLVLNSNDLTITGNIAAGGTGTISSTTSSNVTVQTTTALSGGLTFTSTANTVNDFTVNAGTGNSLGLNSDLNITGALQLQGGTIDIDDNDITIASSGSVTGGSSTSYVITDGGGTLGIALTANDSAMFHVGTSASYAPAQVGLNNGSGSGTVRVNVDGDVMSQGTMGVDISTNQSVVDATWHVESDISSNLNLNLKVMWSAALEVNSFNRSAARLSHFVSGSWDTNTNAAAKAEANSMFSLRRNGLTSLSPFAVFDQNTSIGIKDVASVEFGMYPNPTAEQLIISCTNATEKNMMVDIMDVTGSVIKSYNMTSDKYSVPVATFANGTYFARVYNDKVSTVKPFSKL
jgi:hypothetical protein